MYSSLDHGWERKLFCWLHIFLNENKHEKSKTQSLPCDFNICDIHNLRGRSSPIFLSLAEKIWTVQSQIKLSAPVKNAAWCRIFVPSWFSKAVLRQWKIHHCRIIALYQILSCPNFSKIWTLITTEQQPDAAPGGLL